MGPWLGAKRVLAMGAGGLLSSGAFPAGAQAPVPVGAEFQANTYTTNGQNYPSVAVDADGDFVVVWASYGSPGSDSSATSVQGQRYDSAGSAVGGQFQVNTHTPGYQVLPSVAVGGVGEFVVVWEDQDPGSDSSGSSIQGQRYDSAGSAVGGQFQVNTYTTNHQRVPSVAVAGDGDFVVVWQSFGSFGSDSSGDSIQGQRYDSAGSAVGSQFQVNTYTTLNQRVPSVAAAGAGDFVVVWQGQGLGSDSSGYGIQGQRYNGAGSAVGGQFQVNSYTTGNQRLPSVSVEGDGDFVVAWQSYGSPGSDSSDDSIQGQRYDSAGSAVGSQFQVNTYTTNYQRLPSVSAEGDGDFVVVWTSDGSSGSDSSGYSVQGQRYDGAGSAVGSQFQVNTYTTGSQRLASVGVKGDGDFVVVWESFGSSGSDSSGNSIQAQRYTAPPVVPSLSPAGFAAAALLLLLAVGTVLRRRS